jgi:N-acetylglucosaminyl-diphospho-decaprenol L-rhamnosyltransferase
LRRAAFQEAGSFNESHLMYTEVVDLCYRLRQAGWKLWYVPQVQVLHHGGASVRQVAEAIYLQLHRSKIQFYRKYGGQLWTDQFKCYVRLACWPRWVACSVAATTQPTFTRPAGLSWQLLDQLPGM